MYFQPIDSISLSVFFICCASGKGKEIFVRSPTAAATTAATSAAIAEEGSSDKSAAWNVRWDIGKGQPEREREFNQVR